MLLEGGTTLARTKEFDPTVTLYRAVEVFGHYGYEGATMPHLLSGLGIARQSLYDTYGTKHDLFVQAVKLYLTEKSDWTVKHLAHAVSPKLAIVQTLNEVVASLGDDARRRACFVLLSATEQAPHDPEVAALLDRDMVRVEEAFYAALVRARDLGEVGLHHNLRALARYLNHARYWLTQTARFTTDPSALSQTLVLILSALEV